MADVGCVGWDGADPRDTGDGAGCEAVVLVDSASGELGVGGSGECGGESGGSIEPASPGGAAGGGLSAGASASVAIGEKHWRNSRGWRRRAWLACGKRRPGRCGEGYDCIAPWRVRGPTVSPDRFSGRARRPHRWIRCRGSGGGFPEGADRYREEPIAKTGAHLTVVEHHASSKPIAHRSPEAAQASKVRPGHGAGRLDFHAR